MTPSTADTDDDAGSTTASEAAERSRTAQTTATTTATATTAPVTERTGAHTDEAAEAIMGARARIDAIDDRIIGLVQERMAISAVIQKSRIASGGRRVNLSREMEVLARYRTALGKRGTTLAMTLLELCRGRI